MEVDVMVERFSQAIASIPDAWKARLLWILDMGDEDRAEAIGAMYQDGRLPNVAEMLMDLEEVPIVRKVVAAEIRTQLRPPRATDPSG
jgi:hypothetical protein